MLRKSTCELTQSANLLAQRQSELLALIRQSMPELISDNQLDIATLERYELLWAGKPEDSLWLQTLCTA